MQIEKNQREINFRIAGANFRKNLNLAVTLGIVHFKNLPRIYIRGCGFYSFIFFFRC